MRGWWGILLDESVDIVTAAADEEHVAFFEDIGITRGDETWFPVLLKFFHQEHGDFEIRPETDPPD